MPKKELTTPGDSFRERNSEAFWTEDIATGTVCTDSILVLSAHMRECVLWNFSCNVGLISQQLLVNINNKERFAVFVHTPCTTQEVHTSKELLGDTTMNVSADTQLLGTTSGDTTNYRRLIKLHVQNAAIVAHYNDV